MDPILFRFPPWDIPRGLLLTSALFAIGAVAFFLAVWLQLQGPAQQPNAIDMMQVSMQDKERVLNELSENAPTSALLSPGQASPTDPNAQAKLRILQQLKTD